MAKYFIGIDVGTQGARVVLLDEYGAQLSAKEEGFELTQNSREEQSPLMWWETCQRLMGALFTEVKEHIPLQNIVSIAVTSTSGTIIPLNHSFNPIHPAIMYSDSRSAKEAEFCREIAEKEVKEGYTAFNASSGLPKMRWFLNQYPSVTDDIYKFIHAADFITGRLCGEYGITDYTNALKSGYDIHQYKWPSYVSERIGIQPEWLQKVKPSGTPLGPLFPSLAAEWGLPDSIMVTTGITDGCASQVASGAVGVGEWNTTIGTTMVIKGVSKKEVIDPSGAIYNHRHPEGYWMPGGASNTGADWVSALFGRKDLSELNRLAFQHMPSEHLAWPLIQKGERFPFFAPQARGFWPEVDDVSKFTACMEGVAFIERFAFEKIAELSGERIEKIFSAGGGSKGEAWLKIRSTVLNRPVAKMQNASGAVGAAILAASKTYYDSIQQAASAMALPESVIEPLPELVEVYDQKYRRFINELRGREIII